MEQDTLNRDTLKNDILEVLLDADNSGDVFSHVDRFHCMEIVDRIVEVVDKAYRAERKVEAVGKVHNNVIVTCPRCNNRFLPSELKKLLRWKTFDAKKGAVGCELAALPRV